MLETLAGAAGTAGSLVSSGGLGMLLGSAGRYFANKQQAAAEARRLDAQLRLAELAADAQTDAAIRSAFEASIKAQASAESGAPRWVRTICALMRPGLTLSFCVAFLRMLDPATLMRYLPDMTATAFGYWFGDRGMTPKSER